MKPNLPPGPCVFCASARLHAEGLQSVPPLSRLFPVRITQLTRDLRHTRAHPGLEWKTSKLPVEQGVVQSDQVVQMLVRRGS